MNRAAVYLITFFVVAGCGGEPIFETAPPVVSLSIRPDSARVAVGSTTNFDIVRDGESADSIDRAWKWSTGDSLLAVVDQVGIVLGKARGRTTVEARHTINGDVKNVRATVIVE